MPKSPEQKNLENNEAEELAEETPAEKTEFKTPEISQIPDEQPKDQISGQERREQQRKETLESLRKELFEKNQEKNEEDEISLTKRLRMPRQFESPPVPLDPEEKTLIYDTAESTEIKLEKNYEPGYGIFPASDPKENFYEQIWTRDFGHASGNYFADKNPKAIADSLDTIFKHQREDGMLPLRVEKDYLLLKVFPGLRFLAKPLFNLIEKRLKRRNERPVYEGQDFSSAQDTVPTTLIAVGEFYINSAEGKRFVREHFEQIKKAADFFQTKSDPEDGLISVKKGNADWADSIMRAGKLGNINVWWTRSLRMLEFMANDLGRKEEAKKYRDEFHQVKKSVMEKFYNKEEGYFRAEEGKDRIDAVASIFGSLYLLNPTEAVKIQETLKERMATPAGLKNFDPPYPKKQILWPLRAIGHAGYHNKDIWPWVTLQNIQAKIKIALQHPEQNIRNQYKSEAIKDLADVADLFKDAGGAYEIFNPNTRQPAVKKRLFIKTYQPPKNIMGNMAAYQGAYNQLKELGWL